MPHGFGRLRVLLIDDEAFVLVIMRRILNALGIELIEEARDGQEALGLLESMPFDLLFLDLQMAPMDGIELLRRMRQHNMEGIREIPVIVLTLNSDAETVNRLVPLGIEDYLVKPVAPDVLRRKIERIVSTKGA